MWSVGVWFPLVMAIVLLGNILCNPVSTPFNENLRSYSVKEDINSTARTLQQEDLVRYANFAPVTNPIRFKRLSFPPHQPYLVVAQYGGKEEVPDNALSGSAYSRGLVHHDHGGYGLHGFDDGHYSYGYDFDHHGLNHLEDYHGHGHHGHHLGHGIGHGHGFHHKHYNPALAAKTILWPLAGLAILGTAAALVSNPVLLQLGVISGRRRRDTHEVTEPEFEFHKWEKDVGSDEMNFKVDSKKVFNNNRNAFVPNGSLKKIIHTDGKLGALSKKAYQIAQSTVQSVTLDAPEHNGNADDDRLVPIALKVKRN